MEREVGRGPAARSKDNHVGQLDHYASYSLDDRLLLCQTGPVPGIRAAMALEAIRFSRGGGLAPASLQLLEQRKLPLETEWLDIDGPQSAWTAIRDMTVRGAPAIGAPPAACRQLLLAGTPASSAAAAGLLTVTIPNLLCRRSHCRRAEPGGRPDQQRRRQPVSGPRRRRSLRRAADGLFGHQVRGLAKCSIQGVAFRA